MVAKMEDARIEDRRIHIEVNGQQHIFELGECTGGELEIFKTLLMWALHTLIGQRDLLHEAIAKVNGELDRRVNEKACPPPAPPITSFEGKPPPAGDTYEGKAIW